MKRNNFWFVLFLLMCGLFVFTSCGNDDDDELKPDKENNNSSGNGNSTDADGWKTDAGSLKTATSYYIGTWYNVDQLSVFMVYKQQGYTQGMKQTLYDGLEFYQNGTGAEVWYNGSSSKKGVTNFTWKVIKTKRPQIGQDYLVIKYQYESCARNIILYNSEIALSYADRGIGSGIVDYGDGEYGEWDDWRNYVRYTGYTLSW